MTFVETTVCTYANKSRHALSPHTIFENSLGKTIRHKIVQKIRAILREEGHSLTMLGL